MGFYIRQSVKVGPLRFNFSKSGVGVSAGVKGLRIGTGPRGNYIHMGAGGLYYRTTLLSKRKAASSSARPSEPQLTPRSPSPSELAGSVGPMVSIDSASVQQLVDTTSTEVLEQINKKRRMPDYWKAVAGLLAVLFLMALSGSDNEQSGGKTGVVVLGMFFAILLAVTYYYNKMSKAIVFFYDLEDSAKDAYESLTSAFEPVLQANKQWRLNSRGAVLNQKYHAGANQLVTRSTIQVTETGADFIKTNVPVPSLSSKALQLFFYPDRVIVFDGSKVGAVAYGELRVSRSVTRFIESDGVPSDSSIVDKTWRYVNKKGGPDKRFKNNTQIPIVEYEEIHFTSSSGLNELFQVSKAGAGADIAIAVNTMARHSRQAAS